MFANSTVLLAEDDPDDVMLTQLAFKRARLANPLAVVRDGEEALAYLEGESCYADRDQYPFLILLLLDLNMPKVNGFQVLEWLREHPPLHHLPVAVLTSSDHDPHAERAFGLGADSYLIKPPDAEALLAFGPAPARLLAHRKRSAAGSGSLNLQANLAQRIRMGSKLRLRCMAQARMVAPYIKSSLAF